MILKSSKKKKKISQVDNGNRKGRSPQKETVAYTDAPRPKTAQSVQINAYRSPINRQCPATIPVSTPHPSVSLDLSRVKEMSIESHFPKEDQLFQPPFQTELEGNQERQWQSDHPTESSSLQHHYWSP